MVSIKLNVVIEMWGSDWEKILCSLKTELFSHYNVFYIIQFELEVIANKRLVHIK